MSTRALYKSTLGLMLLALTLAACQPPIVEVPVTVVVEQTRVVSVAVTPTQPTAPPMPSFTTPHPILGDLRVRQGIAHCTDKAEIIKSVYPWLGDPAPLEIDTFVRREHWAYPQDDPNLVRYPFDPEQGKALFEAAGWTLAGGATYRTNGAGEEMALKFTTTTANFRQTWAAVFEEQMKACGLRTLRFHTPAAWWFGDTTGLARRDFELGAFAWVVQSDPGGRNLYACDQIPSPENGWKGQNYMGWCNPEADEAIRTATSSLDPQVRREAYRIVQEEFTQDLPSLPLFSRVQVMAVNPALQNFAPNFSEPYYTWNAAQWVVPGKDTLVIGEGSEPASLFVLESAFTSQVLRILIAGVDYTSQNFEYQPVMLTQMPTIENGAAAAVPNTVEVREGEGIVDADGNAVELKPGVRLRDADGNEVDFTGGTARMKQLVVKYEFVDGLMWSDGTPVSKADYELAHRVLCDPVFENWFFDPPGVCEKTAGVEFVSDTAYVVTWKPGYQDPLYFRPPFTRLPAHQIVSDGRRLADVPASQWDYLDEVRRTPLGVGPYVLTHWENGRRMEFTANPFYFQGPPATPNVVVRFFNSPEQAIAALAAGEVDVLGWDTVFPDQAAALLEAQAAGKARVYFTPTGMWEHIDFALFVK